MIMNCEKVAPLISGLLDGELTQQEEQAIHLHLQSCRQCRHTFEELASVKKLSQQFGEQSVDALQAEQLLNDVKSSYLAGAGWFLIAIAVCIVFWSALVFFMDASVPLRERMYLGALGGGVLFLFLSVLRQQLILRKTDKYRKVKL